MRPSARTRIVECVLDELIQNARADFTFEEVAGLAGVSRQTVHGHFGSRGELLVAVADLARQRHHAPELVQAVYAAPTAVAALDALVDFHVAFTPGVMWAALVVDLERLRDPELEKAFEARSEGRRQLARHVVTRLKAEGVLGQVWATGPASDLVAALLSPATTAELMSQSHWTAHELRDRLRVTLRRLLLSDSQPIPTHQKD